MHLERHPLTQIIKDRPFSPQDAGKMTLYTTNSNSRRSPFLAFSANLQQPEAPQRDLDEIAAAEALVLCHQAPVDRAADVAAKRVIIAEWCGRIEQSIREVIELPAPEEAAARSLLCMQDEENRAARSKELKKPVPLPSPSQALSLFKPGAAFRMKRVSRPATSPTLAPHSPKSADSKASWHMDQQERRRCQNQRIYLYPAPKPDQVGGLTVAELAKVLSEEKARRKKEDVGWMASNAVLVAGGTIVEANAAREAAMQKGAGVSGATKKRKAVEMEEAPLPSAADTSATSAAAATTPSPPKKPRTRAAAIVAGGINEHGIAVAVDADAQDKYGGDDSDTTIDQMPGPSFTTSTPSSSSSAAVSPMSGEG